GFKDCFKSADMHPYDPFLESESTQSKPVPLSDLDELWMVNDRSGLRCYACGGMFDNEALIRTFLFQSVATTTGRNNSIRTTARDYQIVFYNRHVQCFHGIRYIAVSHVWNATVSDAHVQGPSTTLKEAARNHILESVERMRIGLDGNLDLDTEVWYDYLSVPQWETDLKLSILRAIPEVFANASFTFVHLDDVHSSAINLIRNGTNSSARVLGITSVCNATWFKRVWTVMEYIRSNTVKMVTSDGSIYPSDELLQDVFKVWDRERELLGDIHALEGLAGLGTNIVPWNLGPLHVARLRKKIDFGSAFSLLSRRGCRSRGDFFHALLGIVKADCQGDLAEDPVKATLTVATKCLEAGDYSPLLVVPRPEPVDPASLPPLYHTAGYIDILAFGLQPSTGFPEFYSESTFELESSQIKLERIGTVEHAVRADGYGPFDTYIYCAHIALQYTGPVVDAFVETVCARLYNMPASHITDILSNNDNCSQLLELLEEWYNAPTTTLYSEPSLSHAFRIADILGLNRTNPLSHPHTTPLDFMFEHGVPVTTPLCIGLGCIGNRVKSEARLLTE
ncbi:uncharacterized protein N0V89_003754, partial [Didymosphaeria variabile]